MNTLKSLWHKLGSPRWFFDLTRRWPLVLGVLATLLLAVGSIWGLAFAPPDYQQGNSARIMYVHVPTAILAESCYVLMGIAGAAFLIWRVKLADVTVRAAAPIGMALTALALASGAIWARPTWGAWWVWDARTTSMLVLLFLYFGVIALRGAIGREETAGRAAAMLAVVGLVNIPIIKYSVDWWLSMHQSSSFSLTDKPSMPPSMYLPLIVNMLGFHAFFGAALIKSMQNEILSRERRTRWVRERLGATGS